MNFDQLHSKRFLLSIHSFNGRYLHSERIKTSFSLALGKFTGYFQNVLQYANERGQQICVPSVEKAISSVPQKFPSDK